MSLPSNHDEVNLSPTSRFLSLQSPGENPPGGIPRRLPGGRVPDSANVDAFRADEGGNASILLKIRTEQD